MHNRRLGGAVLLSAIVLAGLAWRAVPGASQPGPVANRPGQESVAVQRLPIGADADPGRKGSTYFWLESQSTRVTSEFDDGMVIVGERGADGALHVRASDRAGSELARLDIADTLRYTPASGESFRAVIHPSVRPTLEWANRQTYGLVKEGTQGLSWNGGLMRAGRADLRARAVETEWAGGLVAKTSRRSHVREYGSGGRIFSGDALSVKLTRNGEEIGEADFFAQAQLFRWRIPALRVQGYVEPRNLERHGGWPFAPDAEWLNLQILALHHFKRTIDERGFVASRLPGCGTATAPSLASQVVKAIVPTLQANEPGCDNLHWLDGSVFRYCCDIHDRCYEKYGCSSSSWWQWWTNWNCTRCNRTATWCFVTMGCMYLGSFCI